MKKYIRYDWQNLEESVDYYEIDIDDKQVTRLLHVLDNGKFRIASNDWTSQFIEVDFEVEIDFEDILNDKCVKEISKYVFDDLWQLYSALLHTENHIID